MQFEVEILKGPAGVGLCLVVNENPKKGTIEIKKVLPEITIKSITAGAGGSIQPGDTLIRVRNEPIIRCPLVRLVQKINDFRVPIGSTVKLAFERMVQ